jgi:sulfur-oxidizing protein SoxY
MTIPKIAFTRRQAITAGAGALALASGLAPRPASATPESLAAYLAKMTGGKKAIPGKVSLKLPEIAENGAIVPLTVAVDSPMTADNYAKDIVIAAERNPNPEVVVFHLTPASGKAEVSTRIRLGETQDVVATAIMSDGSVYTAKGHVKVTVGGCS